MAIFHFTAEDREGRRVADQIEAPDADAARRLLEQRGLAVLGIAAAETASEGHAPKVELSSQEAQEVAEHLAQLGGTQLPLAPGLRAVAEESDNPRLADALCWLAGQIEQGRALEEALVASPDLLPQYMSGLVAAAARTGQLGAALSELAEHRRAAASLRRGLLGVLAYPLLVACLALLILTFLLTFVAGSFEEMFNDFGTRLPLITETMLWCSHKGFWVLAGLVLGLAIIAALTRRLLRPAGWRRLLTRLPVAGPLWHLSALAEWFGLLVVLIRNQVSMPDALRLAADGVSSPYVAQLSLALAEGVSRGRSLSQMIAAHREIPASLGSLVRWGEKAGDLAGSLAAGREMLEERVRMRSVWLQTILPPCLFIAIGCCVFLVTGALFMPFVSLVSNLSGGK